MKVETQYSALTYWTDFFFHNYKLPIEFDGIAHQNCYLGKDIERQKAIVKRLNCTFIRINSDSFNFDGDREINGMFCQMKQSIKKKFVDETTSRLLSLQFKKYKHIKTKAKRYSNVLVALHSISAISVAGAACH